METVSVTVKSMGQTVERIVSRQIGRNVPGVVEATFDLNRGLADHGPILPVGTTFLIPLLTEAEIAKSDEVIVLTD